MVGRLGPRIARIVAALATVGILGAAAACEMGGSANNGASVVEDDGSMPDASIDSPDESEASPSDPSSEGGIATASLDSTSLNFSSLPCGGSPLTLPLHVKNSGMAMLAVSATAVGAGFSVTPAVLQIEPGQMGTLTVSASAAGAAATAGSPLSGSLELFTNDPVNSHISVALSATPTGAVLSFEPGGATSFGFPATQVGVAALPISLTVVNSGNSAGTFTIAPPSAPQFSFTTGGPDAGAQTIALAAGAMATLSAGFTPTSAGALTASAAVTTSSATCAGSLQSIPFTGEGATGIVSGWPATIDFGPTSCGGSAPPSQTFVLSNTGTVNATVTSVKLSGTAGFGTDLVAGRAIPAGAQHTVTVSVTAPAVPPFAPMSPVTATLSVQTDADTSPHVIALTEEPSGAVLAFDTSATTNFGSFGSVVLLRSSSQPFAVKNTGNAKANITLTTAAGAMSGTAPFQVSTPFFTLGPAATQAEVMTFTPMSAPVATSQLSITATGAVCSGLPSPLPLSGAGIGGAPTVTTSQLAFGALCGGAAPNAQSFLVRNDGGSDMTWYLGPITGVGASQYSVQVSPAPGLLHPGAAATVVVTAAAMPSPATNPLPSAYAAQLTITTDVPLDPPHVVTLGETPLGDQLGFTVASPLRFGQVPIQTSLGQNINISNSGNPGSPPANVSLQITGAGAAAYSVTPPTVSGLAPGGQDSSNETVTFSPPAATPYAAGIALATTDALCSALPQPLALSGTGTSGVVSVSATTLTFGTDPQDPAGLVNCGATGMPRTLTISNVGNQVLRILGVALGKGQSPFTLSGAAAAVPVSITMGQSSTLTVTPNPIPAQVANPADPSAFADTLTITTDAALDSPHVVNLVMQARGAIIANTPLPTAWTFGAVAAGGIATYASAIHNTGNAPALVTLQGLTAPSIFGLAGSPVTATANAVTPIVGQFTPPSADGVWSDQGTLVVSAVQAFCSPLPAGWTAPVINLSGSSDANAPVAVSGSLAFPASDCGSAAPAGQAVVVSNATGAPLGYTARLGSGTFYSLSPSTGSVPAGGIASIVVTPRTLTPGAGVVPGAAPYADNLVITVATSPPTTLTVPVSWTLNGAVLTLPDGAGPNLDAKGHGFYVADSTSGFPLPLGNTGTATANVSVAVQPFGSFFLTPAPPISVIPGIGASPQLVSASTAPACPATALGTLTFVYSGPVCQPLPVSSVNVQACAGTY